MICVVIRKNELADILVEKTGSTKKEAKEFINVLIETITEQLASGDKVKLIGFGTFLTKKRETKQGRNPVTGETINIPASIMPVFKPGKSLKDKANSI